jgi:hypothetical protein
MTAHPNRVQVYLTDGHYAYASRYAEEHCGGSMSRAIDALVGRAIFVEQLARHLMTDAVKKKMEEADANALRKQP